MSKEKIQEVIIESLNTYFADLGDSKPFDIYNMVILAAEKPTLEAVMKRANGNQSHAAAILGINRNTLRKKLLHHGLSKT